MRIGAIVTAMVGAISAIGVVEKYDDKSMTAVFPVRGGSKKGVVLKRQKFLKGENKAHRAFFIEQSAFGEYLRYLTDIKYDNEASVGAEANAEDADLDAAEAAEEASAIPAAS